MEFKSYSQTRSDLKEKFYPKLELRSWNEVKIEYRESLEVQLYQIWYINAYSLIQVLEFLHLRYRRMDFGFSVNYDGTGYNFEIVDATNIALNRSIDEFFFYELLSNFFWFVDEIDVSGKLRKKLEKVCESIFSHFGVNMMIRNNQFVPRQSEKIVKEVYDPTFNLLNDSTYEGVNSELNKAFESFRAKDYDDVITKSINAVQAAMQILVDGEVTQKKNISALLKEAQRNKLLSDYELTNNIYSNINSFLERVRKEKAGVHPTSDNANQSDALFILNLTMVLLQNLILSINKKVKG